MPQPDDNIATSRHDRSATEGPVVSILIPSYKRLERLRKCLESLAAQSYQPDQIVVAWQGEDTETAETARTLGALLNLPIKTTNALHPGIVPAENAGLEI